MAEDIVITGMGLVTPIGIGEDAFWAAMVEGRSGVAPVTGFDHHDWPRHVACQVREDVEACTGLGRASKLAVAACQQALASSRLSTMNVEPSRRAVVVGTTMGETEFIEARIGSSDAEWLGAEHVQRIVEAGPGSVSQSAAVSMGGAVAVDLYGACAAGNMAIADARRRLLAHECDIALAGGSDGFSMLAFIGFMRARVMAAENCRPFDARRDGLLVGEGAALLVMERESDARARGAAIRARVAGAGLACEDFHPTRPHPEGEGLARATEMALADACVRADEVDYVCAHGTGTPQNDQIEAAVMDRLFPRGVAFSSIKALTGHTMGAAGAIEAAACVLMLERRSLIPTWGLDEVLTPCGQDAVRGGPRAAVIRRVVNNSAGFGGYNSSVVLCAA